MEFNYYMPSRIFFGKGSLENLGTEKLPGKKALIVTSAGGSMRKYGYLDRVTALLDKNHTEYVLFEKILPNPIKSHVMEGAQLAREAGCDFVIGLGGGSSIDSSKSIAVMAANDGDYWDYVNGGSGKGLEVPNNPLPVIAITTTAGTGTESDPWTVVTKEETGEKIGFGYDKTFPYFSIVDPDLMMSIPPYLTAYQGFDALFHSTEGYIANISNFMSDMYALKAIELIGKYLVRAVKDGSDEEARAGVALANTLSGFVESTSSCTSEHSLEHALSGYHPKLTHGAGLIMVSAAYYETFAATVPERYVQMAKALGRRDASQASDFIEALKDLQKACGVDDLKMSDFDVDKDDLKKYALHALDTMGGLFEYDPYKLTLDEIVNILEKSYR
ncbi:iron-containing alcohol dehydrogenase [Candidatus Soleaferrea massiliensis]|uniref:iron-containing alcohol dehydrogenase n=1 Tax=Candidatus Soleaferrea massiliensis TaxID=1470354 RepID=UPI0005917D9E|nr:iron-containing alcohol dehydrogenase [Candidatus Soleaferrea massiliensis]